MKKYLVISGKVQGVGFRYWMKNLAINNNINGWVKNKINQALVKSLPTTLPTLSRTNTPTSSNKEYLRLYAG